MEEREETLREEETALPEEDRNLARRIARLESLRRWMLILTPLPLIGGFAADCLPVLYASAIPLAVALIVTYRIKHLEEKQASGNRHQTRS